VHAEATSRIALVVEAHAAALRVATRPQASGRSRARLEALINRLRDDLDALDAALVLNADEWDPGSEPTREPALEPLHRAR
jgi:hypothetical protein